MTRARFKQLAEDGHELNQAEIDEGWHFCAEFDGLLVKGDPKEPHCGQKCVDGEYKVKLSDSNPFA